MTKIGIVYEIKFENGKSYVGQTINLKKRKISHNWYSKNGSELAVHRAMRKYDYEWFILEEVSLEKLDDKEKYYIETKDTFKNGYNLNKGGKKTVRSHSYTYDDFYNSAIKYKSKKEWRESEDKHLCNSCRKNYPELYKKVTKHMKRPNSCKKYSDSYLLKVASKFKYLHELREQESTIYSIIIKRNLLKEINLKSIRRKTYDDIKENSILCETYKEWRTCYKNDYCYARKRNWHTAIKEEVFNGN